MLFLLNIPSMLLMAAAIVPAVFLMVQVFKTDRLEPESPQMLTRLVIGGVISTLIAMALEWVGSFALDMVFPEESVPYYAWMYFAVVGPAEEGAKYFMLKRRSWRDPEFNCQYDGVVYAVFVSLGFALWENISYVMSYGVGVAVVRALTAIPGHACFGVLMGIFYGIAKKYDRQGKGGPSRTFRILAFIIPAFTHGMYDYIATVDTGNAYFITFIAIVFVVCFILVQKMSKADKAI
jgi:RsiW-degrading membrane proteinase PrsW (M82 family)